MLGWIYFMFSCFLLKWLMIKIHEGNLSDLPISDGSWFSVYWEGPLLAFSFSSHYLILEMRIRTIACSSSINLSWFLLFHGWRVGIHWRCKIKFLLDCLCLLATWRRVIVLCLLTIRQPSRWSRKELHWNLHESFISNVLGMSSCARGYSWDTVSWPLLIYDVCWYEEASRYLGPCCRHAGRCVASCFSSAS